MSEIDSVRESVQLIAFEYYKKDNNSYIVIDRVNYNLYIIR